MAASTVLAPGPLPRTVVLITFNPGSLPLIAAEPEPEAVAVTRTSRIVTFGAAIVIWPVTSLFSITCPAVDAVIEPEGVRVATLAPVASLGKPQELGEAKQFEVCA